jgi:hypothetical protein
MGMPVLWAVRNGIVFVTLMGDYAFDEIRAATAHAYADARTPARAPLLIDGRSSLVYLSPEEIQIRSEWYRDLLQRRITARCAMIVGESEYRQQIVAQGMAPLQEAGLTVRSFAQFADALAWLRAPGEPSEDRS